MDAEQSISLPKLANASRPVVVSIFLGLGTFLLLVFGNGIYVHYNFGGEYYGPFLYSELWGVTPAEEAMGMLPVYAAPGAGWDGQFYYRQSIDPFLLGDGPKFSDNVSYRYQRNGVSILAWTIGKGCGYSLTPAWLYQATQFALISFGMSILIYWLMDRGLSPIYAFTWLLSSGLWSLLHGLPDTSADAVFILSMVSLMYRKIGLYVAATSLLLLVREGYAAYAATVFLLTLAGKMDWRTTSRYWAALSSTLPGVVLLSWTAFVAHQLKMPFMQGAKSVPWGNLVDLPFRAFFEAIRLQWQIHPEIELTLKVLSAVTIVIVLLTCLLHIRKSPESFATLPYVILMSMLGAQIWENETGYLKAVGSVILIGVFMLPLGKNYLLKAVLLLHLISGIHTANRFNIVYQPYLHKSIVQANRSIPEPKKGLPIQFNEKLDRFEYSLEVTQRESPKIEAGIFRYFHRYPAMFHVSIRNESNNTLISEPNSSPTQVGLSYQLFDSKTNAMLFNWRSYPTIDIPPGGNYQMTICIPTPLRAGEYEVKLILVQGDSTFLLEDKGGKIYSERYVVP